MPTPEEIEREIKAIKEDIAKMGLDARAALAKWMETPEKILKTIKTSDVTEDMLQKAKEKLQDAAQGAISDSKANVDIKRRISELQYSSQGEYNKLKSWLKNQQNPEFTIQFSAQDKEVKKALDNLRKVPEEERPKWIQKPKPTPDKR